jgi:hypothetical protein
MLYPKLDRGLDGLWSSFLIFRRTFSFVKALRSNRMMWLGNISLEDTSSPLEDTKLCLFIFHKRPLQWFRSFTKLSNSFNSRDQIRIFSWWLQLLGSLRPSRFSNQVMDVMLDLFLGLISWAIFLQRGGLMGPTLIICLHDFHSVWSSMTCLS